VTWWVVKDQLLEAHQQPIAAAEGTAGVAESQGGWAGSPWHSSDTQGKCPGGLYCLAIAWGCSGGGRRAKAWLELDLVRDMKDTYFCRHQKEG